MYCPKCGKQNDDNNFKCTSCRTIIQQMPHSDAPVLVKSTSGVILAVIGGAFFAIMMIGILAAIAIPQFSAYRTRSYNSSAQADLRNAATAQEAFYVDNSSYTNSLENLVGSYYGLSINQDVNIQILKGDEYGYMMVASHKSGDRTYQLTGPGGTIQAYNKDD